MHFRGESGGFGRAVAQAEGCEHVALSGYAASCAASFERLFAYLVPEVQFRLFHFPRFRIGLYFFYDAVDFLHFEVDDVVHDALGLADVHAE